jgi:hypothetical protein
LPSALKVHIQDIARDAGIDTSYIEGLIGGFDWGTVALSKFFLSNQNEEYLRGQAKGIEFHRWVSDERHWMT